jgi:twinkle protein
MKTFEEFGIDLRGRSGIEVKTTCPQCSKDRKKKNYPCLSVNTERGLWHCWHCEWSGSLGQGEEFKPIRRKVYRKPEYSTPLMLDPRAHEWLKGRGLTEEVIERARIGFGRIYMPQVEEEIHAIQFPYFQDGECINVKFRDFDKNFRMYSGAERVLYGLDDIGEITIIVEGEIDKLSFAAAGHWNCVSVPDGAPVVNAKDYSTCVSEIWAHERQTDDSNLRVFNKLRL